MQDPNVKAPSLSARKPAPASLADPEKNGSKPTVPQTPLHQKS